MIDQIKKDAEKEIGTKLQSLTPEQEALIPQFVEKWVNNITKLRMTRKNAVKAAHWLYKLANLPYVPEVFICTSPRHCLDVDKSIKKLLKIDNPPDAEFLGYGKVTDYGWVAFYDFFETIGVEVTQIFKDYRDIYIAAGIYDAITYDTHFICCPNPTIVHWNEKKKLHNLFGKAVEWADGWGSYAVNGIPINGKLFEAALDGTITDEMLAAIEKEEEREALLLVLNANKK